MFNYHTLRIESDLTDADIGSAFTATLRGIVKLPVYIPLIPTTTAVALYTSQ